ncbi:hypothetical protein IJ541_07845 [bacterium]|nr:hypothetical protein [bacterium]MBQ9246930.1 hypothetical protein [bacterium]
MNNLFRLGNNIITSYQYPTGIKHFGQAHRQISKMYEQILGKEPQIGEFNDCWDYFCTHNAFKERMNKLIRMNLWAGANISQKVVGKHKIPRYLYHLTTRKNYNQMLQDGYLRISQDCPRGDGVYMFEMQNMLKQYKDFDGRRNLGLLLSLVVNRDGSEAILLRIPTSKMDVGKLVIRDNTGGGRNGMHSYTKVALGDSALASKLYKQRKVALEYIYPEQLSMDNITVVGTSKYDFIQDYRDENTILKMWKNLTQNQPEQIGFLKHIFKVDTYSEPIVHIAKKQHEQVQFL